jgi:purine-binding chemotaxis protein CheW
MTTQPDDELLQLCVWRVGQEDYVVDLRRIDEILAVPQVTRVPRSPSFLHGVVKLRGDVLPVIDVRKRLASSAGAAWSEPLPQVLTPSGKVKLKERLVVCRIGTRRVGFIVDAVTQVMKVARSTLRPAPLTNRPGGRPHVLGVCGDQDALKLMLDVKALVFEELS